MIMNWNKDNLGLISLENYRLSGAKREIDKVFDKSGNSTFSKSLSPKLPMRQNQAIASYQFDKTNCSKISVLSKVRLDQVREEDEDNGLMSPDKQKMNIESQTSLEHSHGSNERNKGSPNLMFGA